MNEYRPIIIKALKAAPPNATPERQADLILAYIDIAKDLIGDVAPRSDIRREIDVPLIGDAPDPQEPPAPPRRITGKPAKPDQQYRDLDDLYTHVQQHAPPTIEVDLGDGKPALTLRRQITRREFSVAGVSDGTGIVQLRYTIQGEEGAPADQFSTNDASIDVNGAVKRIMEAAKCMYSRTQRKVEPKAPKPVSWNMDDVMENAPHGDADGAMGRNGENPQTSESVVEFFRSQSTAEERKLRQGG